MDLDLNQKKIRESLHSAVIISRLPLDMQKRVRKHAKLHRLKEGETLFSQGDEMHAFYLTLSGSIKLYRLSPEGQEKIIEISNAGHIFAEALMFMEHPHYPVHASALTDAEVIAIDAQDFSNMLRTSVDACFLLMADMSQRLHHFIKEIDDLSLHSGTCRVATYLFKQAPADADIFRLDVPKGVIAARLSVKPETFSRIIKNLSERNLLTVNGSQITIHDRHSLSLISGLQDY
jgi:CRP-like cAMP-binding protein